MFISRDGSIELSGRASDTDSFQSRLSVDGASEHFLGQVTHFLGQVTHFNNPGISSGVGLHFPAGDFASFAVGVDEIVVELEVHL